MRIVSAYSVANGLDNAWASRSRAEFDPLDVDDLMSVIADDDPQLSNRLLSAWSLAVPSAYRGDWIVDIGDLIAGLKAVGTPPQDIVARLQVELKVDEDDEDFTWGMALRAAEYDWPAIRLSGAASAELDWDVRGPSTMMSQLEKARARADRHREEFALVLIAGPTGSAKRLWHLLRNHLRISDEYGQYDSEAVYIILTATGMIGARSFVERLQSVACDECQVSSRMYCYPSGSRSSSQLYNISRRVGDVPHPLPDRLEDLWAKPLPRWKRFIDVTCALLGLVLLSGFLLAIGVAIKLTSPGPAIFRQRRAGWRGRPFTIYKFRTMVHEAERQQEMFRKLNQQDGPCFKLSNDPRVTWMGRFLRATCIDELPALVNVLKGDMTLVGPIPIPINESERCDQWQMRRTDVTPGLTCLWQIKGRSVATFDEWMRMDIAYLRARGPLRDLQILLRAFFATLFNRTIR